MSNPITDAQALEAEGNLNEAIHPHNKSSSHRLTIASSTQPTSHQSLPLRILGLALSIGHGENSSQRNDF